MSKLNKNSSGYIFGFALAVILVCGVLLSVVSGALSEKQKMEKELERKKFILQSALGAEVKGLTKPEIASIYADRVEELIVNSKGEIQTGMNLSEVVLGKEYKKLDKKGELKDAAIDINLPMYLVKNKDKSKVAFYVMPMYGFGLWDNIWSYVAIRDDLNTVEGVVLDHKGETPGLGARITESKVQERYTGKSIFDDQHNLKSVNMQKGEGNDYSSDPHAVDGMSGSTLTAIGVNNMMLYYLRLYQPYIDGVKQKK